MKLSKLLILSLIGISLLRCSEDKDDSTTVETTVVEDKENIQNSLDNMISGMKSLKAGDGVTAFDNFLNMNNGEVLNENWIDNLFSNLDEQMDLSYVGDSKRFNFGTHTGTYSWNSFTGNWDKNNSPSDKIVLEFPAEASSGSNNAYLSMSNYNDKNVIFNDEQLWLPTSMIVIVKVDDQEVMNLNLKNVSYDNSNFSIPVEIDLEMRLEPYDFSVNAFRETSTKFHFDIEYSNNNSDSFSLASDITLNHSDYENLDPENDIKSVAGTVKYEEFSLQYSADIETLLSLDEPTANQINSLVNIDVYYNSKKIGDLEYRDLDGEEEVFIVYKDGSSENSSVHYDDFIEDLELITLEFIGEWNN